MATELFSIPLGGRVGDRVGRHVRRSAQTPHAPRQSFDEPALRSADDAPNDDADRLNIDRGARDNASASGCDSDTFLVGPENRLLGAMLTMALGAERGAENTATRADWYRLLVLHGPTGCGKTHLAHGLADWWSRQHPREKVVYCHGSEFAQDYAAAVDASREDTWRGEQRSARLFALDNIDELSTKPAAQRELAAMLDALADEQAMVVITAPQHPLQIDRLSAALRSRLAGGLLVPIAPAGDAVRIAIASRFAEARSWSIDPRLLRQLAERSAPSLGELFSVLMELDVRHSHAMPHDELHPTQGQPPRRQASDLNTVAAQLLAERDSRPTPSMRDIALAVCRCFGFTLAELKSPVRRQSLVAARNVAMWLTRELAGKSLQEIGRYFGGRDHTTVLHGCRQAALLSQRDPSARQAIAELGKLLSSGGARRGS